VDADSAAIASAGPEVNRPPQSATGCCPFWTDISELPVLLGAPRVDLAGQAPELDEALGLRLVEGIALVVGGEVEVVQRLLAAPAVDDRAAAVQVDPDLAGDVLLGLRDEGVQGVLQRGEPQAVVDQLAPALLDLPLVAGEFPLDGDALQLLVRGDQRAS
jgi:hypothetical protein